MVIRETGQSSLKIWCCKGQAKQLVPILCTASFEVLSKLNLMLKTTNLQLHSTCAALDYQTQQALTERIEATILQEIKHAHGVQMLYAHRHSTALAVCLSLQWSCLP